MWSRKERFACCLSGGGRRRLMAKVLQKRGRKVFEGKRDSATSVERPIALSFTPLIIFSFLVSVVCCLLSPAEHPMHSEIFLQHPNLLIRNVYKVINRGKS
jgi:hypothetical protein